MLTLGKLPTEEDACVYAHVDLMTHNSKRIRLQELLRRCWQQGKECY